MSSEHGDDWEKFIPGVLLAYRSSVHASTKCTPFEAMYGRKAKLPLDNKTPVYLTEDTMGVIDEGVIQSLADIRNTLHNKMAERIIIAKKHQKKN